MQVLLDTNALIWLIGEPLPSSLGRAVTIISSADKVCASPISIVEIRLKAMLGKLVAPPNILKYIESANVELISYSAGAAEALQSFPQLSRHDPFERMLLGQANAEGMTLLTSDKLLLGLGFDICRAPAL